MSTFFKTMFFANLLYAGIGFSNYNDTKEAIHLIVALLNTFAAGYVFDLAFKEKFDAE